MSPTILRGPPGSADEVRRPPRASAEDSDGLLGDVLDLRRAHLGARSRLLEAVPNLGEGGDGARDEHGEEGAEVQADGDARQPLVVPGQAAGSRQPRERSLDDPPFWKE